MFAKYLRRQCTPAEMKELASLLSQEKAADILDPDMHDLWEQVGEEENSYPVDWNAMYARVTGKRRRVRRSARRAMAIAAAAAVAVLLAGAWYGWRSSLQREAGQGTLAETAADVPPGGNKAVLTLANGTSIALGQNANGLVASQGNTNIVVDSSQLAYQEVAPPKPGRTKSSHTISFNTLTTPRGGQFRLKLPDGTLVWLNAASSIRYPTAFAGRERKVNMSGEAYFEVAADASKPFIVSISSVPDSPEEETIKVLGTHFNINDYPDESTIKTTLVEGSIMVRSAAGKGTVLTPGQQAQLGRNGQMKVVRHADVSETVAWKDGLFVFHQDDLPAIMRRLTRWYDIDVQYSKGAMPTAHFTGAVSKKENLSEVLKMLQLTGGARFTIEGKHVLVSR